MKLKNKIISAMLIMPLTLAIISAVEITSGDWSSIFTTNYRFTHFLVTVLGLITGQPALIEGLAITGSIVISLAVWLLIWITFADIIANFSSFSKGVSWAIGFLVAVITVNLNVHLKLIAFIVGIGATMGIIGIILALIGAFAAFIAVNLGITKVGGWLKGRRMLMKAEEEGWETEAGAKEAGAGIQAAQEIARATRGKKSGKK